MGITNKNEWRQHATMGCMCMCVYMYLCVHVYTHADKCAHFPAKQWESFHYYLNLHSLGHLVSSIEIDIAGTGVLTFNPGRDQIM